MDRERTLTLLQAFGMGTRLLGLFSMFWSTLQLVPRQGGGFPDDILYSKYVSRPLDNENEESSEWILITKRRSKCKGKHEPRIAIKLPTK